MTQENSTPPLSTQPVAMTTAEARKIFDTAALTESDPQKRANIELCREYFTNPTFRKALTDLLADILGLG